MFTKACLELDASIAEVKERLLGHEPSTWLPDVIRASGDWEDRLLAEVGFNLGRRWLGRRGEISVGVPAEAAGTLLVPLSWRSLSKEGLFPFVEADLELARMGARMTQLSLSARYTPPLSVVGSIIDRALLHRVAEAAARDFVERVGEVLAVPPGGKDGYRRPRPSPGGRHGRADSPYLRRPP
ncbi:MAG: hypothetical protein ACREPI_03465 [Candidatus Dormibacterales bacterium]